MTPRLIHRIVSPADAPGWLSKPDLFALMKRSVVIREMGQVGVVPLETPRPPLKRPPNKGR